MLCYSKLLCPNEFNFRVHVWSIVFLACAKQPGDKDFQTYIAHSHPENNFFPDSREWKWRHPCFSLDGFSLSILCTVTMCMHILTFFSWKFIFRFFFHSAFYSFFNLFPPCLNTIFLSANEKRYQFLGKYRLEITKIK